MTINEYLWRLEWLQIKKERKYEYYMKLADRISSPQSTLHGDGTPRAKDPQVRERMLTESSAALEAYYAADDEYFKYKWKLFSQLEQLEYRYRIALDFKYITNLSRPLEQRNNGIASHLRIRKKEVPALLKEAKSKLREVLISEGYEIE